MSEEFNKRWRLVLDDYLSDEHRSCICKLITSMHGIVPNMEEVNKALEFPGMTVTIHLAVTEESVLKMLQNMNDCDYLMLLPE